jgi:tetratricopeptide (TPR) repeat protein
MVGKITLVAAFAVGCLLGGSTATAVAGTRSRAAPQSSSRARAGCPSPQALRSVLAEASERLAQARFQDAGGILTPLAARNCDARISLLLAASWEGQGDASAARAELERAHHRWPANDSIAASLARSYLAAGDNDKAAQALAHFRATPDTPEQEMQMAAVVYLAAHQLQSAEQIARLAYRTYPSLKTLLLLSNTLQMEGRYPDVNRLLGTQRAAYGDSAEFLVTLAESESDAKIYATARDDLQRAIVLEPGRYQAHYLLGNVLAALSQTDQAIAEYRKAIELAPDQPRTWFQLAVVFRAKQDKAGEQNALQRALAIDNHYAPAQCEVGNMLLQDHHAADAIGHLTIAIQYNPRSEKAYFLLARAYAQMGEHERSEQTVRRLIAVRKENRPQQGRISEP